MASELSLDAALDYVERGWPVFPVWWPDDGNCACPRGARCTSAAKHPLSANGFHDATLDPAVVREWWTRTPEANIGSPMGGGRVVVDVDDYHEGDERLRELQEAHEKLPDSPTVLTGGGGSHLYFRGDQAVCKIADGLDFRGAGSYVLLPPSRHVSGKCYEWDTEYGIDFPIVDLPPWVLNGKATTSKVPIKLPEAIYDGQERWRHLLSLAGSLSVRGLTEAEVREQVAAYNLRHCRPPKSDVDVARLVHYVCEHDGNTDLAETESASTTHERFGSWRAAIDVNDYLDGKIPPAVPTLVQRDDGVGLFYPKRLNGLTGEPEAGKGFVAGLAVAEVMALGGVCLYFDFDLDPESVVVRVQAGGASREHLSRLRLHSIAEPLTLRNDGGVRSWTREALDVLEPLTQIPGLSLTVIDGVNRAVGDHGMNPNDGNDISQFMRLMTTPFHERGVTVLTLDHPPKAATNGRYAAGSYQKLAVIDGTYYAVEVERQPAPGAVGRLRLRIAKDRPGGVRANTPAAKKAGELSLAAIVVIDSTGDRPRSRVDSPAEGQWKPTALMERVSRYLEMCPEPASVRSVIDAVEGKGEYVRKALAQLVTDGFVTQTVGARNALLHQSTRMYREVLA